MSDSDDSDDSGLPFDVEIEKYEKRLQLARYRKKYRNVWDYITNRWQNDHVHIVLKDLEQKWRVYSAGSHEQLQNVSDAFRYLQQLFIWIDFEEEPEDTTIDFGFTYCFLLDEMKLDITQLELYQRKIRSEFDDLIQHRR